MLMATMYVLIVNLDPSEVTCSIIDDSLNDKHSDAEMHAVVFEKLCRFFKVTDTEPVRVSADLLMSMLVKLKQKHAIVIHKRHDKTDVDVEMEDEEDKALNDVKQESKTLSKCSDEVKGMFDHVNALSNFNSLYQEYGRSMTSDQLDGRFLFEECANINPSNVTPFSRQGNANKLKDPKLSRKQHELAQIGNTQLTSKRLLDYSATSIHNEDKMLTLSSQLKDIKFPNMIPSSPYSIRAFTPATPVSLALEMVNWLKLKTENAKKSLDSDGFPPVMSRHLSYCKPDTKSKILANLNTWADKVKLERKSDHSTGISGCDSIENFKYLYLKLVDELLHQEEVNTLENKKESDKDKVAKELSRTLYRIEFHKAVFTCAAETILFIYNEHKLVFTQLLEFMNLSVLDFWKLVNSFIVVDPQMPTPLKRHFRDIETKIVTELGWKFGSPILDIVDDILGCEVAETAAKDAEVRAVDVKMKTTPVDTSHSKDNAQK